MEGTQWVEATQRAMVLGDPKGPYKNETVLIAAHKLHLFAQIHADRLYSCVVVHFCKWPAASHKLVQLLEKQGYTISCSRVVEGFYDGYLRMEIRWGEGGHTHVSDMNFHDVEAASEGTVAGWLR